MTANVTVMPDRLSLPFDASKPPFERRQVLVAALPEALQDVLAAGRVERRSRFSEDAFDGLTETWILPATITRRQAAAAQRVLDDIERTILVPAELSYLLARILALLSHFPAKG